MSSSPVGTALANLKAAVAGSPEGGRRTAGGPIAAADRRRSEADRRHRRRLLGLIGQLEAAVAETLALALALPTTPAPAPGGDADPSDCTSTAPAPRVVASAVAATNYCLGDDGGSAPSGPVGHAPAAPAPPVDRTEIRDSATAAWDWLDFASDLITALDVEPSDSTTGPSDDRPGQGASPRRLPSWWRDEDTDSAGRTDGATDRAMRSEDGRDGSDAWADDAPFGEPSDADPREGADDVDALRANVRALRRQVADRDEEIAELRLLLEERSRRAVHPGRAGDEDDAAPGRAWGDPADEAALHPAASAGAARGAVALDELLGFDEVIAEERERLQALQEEWRAKLCQAELELGQERAKLARQRASLESAQSEIHVRQRDLADREQRAGGPRKPSDPAARRWWSRLGLGGDGS